MGGEGTFSGTTYQAGVIGYVCAHILAQSRLGWFGDRIDDTPVAISGEVRGPGDDASVELKSARSFEFQAKHGLTGGKKFQETIARISEQTTEDSPEVVLALDRTSTKSLYQKVANDLDRLRTGRDSPLGPDVLSLLESGIPKSVLTRIRTVAVDVDKVSDPEVKNALYILSTVLDQPDQAALAFSLLAKDGGEVCARQGRRTRKELVDLLEANGIHVAPLPKDARWHRTLDFTKRLLNKRHPDAAMVALDQLEKDINGLDVERPIRYRIAAQRSSAFLQLKKYGDALNAAKNALTFDQNGVAAYATAAYANASLGNLDQAIGYAQAAVAADKTDAMGWAALALVMGMDNQAPPTPPVAVAASEHYRIARLQVAFNATDWKALEGESGELLADGMRTPEVLYFRVVSLLSLANENKSQRSLVEEADRLAAEAVETMADDSNPMTVECLALQAQARYLLGDQDGSDALQQRAQELDPQDVEVVGSGAQLAIRQGKKDEALAILRNPVVDRNSPLLSLRAKLLAERDDSAARHDVLAAIQLAADCSDPDLARLSAAEAAIMIPDVELAEQTLALVSPASADDPRTLLMRGRVAAERRRYPEAIAFYDDAAKRDPARAHEFHAELGAHLVQDDRPQEGVAEFDKVPRKELPTKVVRLLARGLFVSGEFVRAQSLINELAAEGPLPDWGVAMAIDIATKQGDFDTAIKHLSTLVDKDSQKTDLKIDLARRLLEVRRPTEATPHIEDLFARADQLGPVERMQIAQLLHHIGKDDVAIPLAFKSFREKQSDPRIHGAFVVLVLTSDGGAEHPTVVGPETHVELKGDNGGKKRYTIYTEGPIDPIRGELSAADAESLGIMGLKVGDHAPLKSMVGEEWTIANIESALFYAVNDAANHFSERFPTERAFLEGMFIGDGTSVSDLAPLIRSLQKKNERTQAVFDLYRKDIPPLGFVAKATGTSIPAVMQEASARPETRGPLWVEWADAEGQSESREAARDAKEIVLTRSALETCARLGVLDTLPGNYNILVPQSLVYELEADLAEETKEAKAGRSFLSAGDTGLTFTEIPPDHPVMLKVTEHIGAQLDWVRANATVHPRPLEKLGSMDEDEAQAREVVGDSSIDAVQLAEHRHAAMYADDLGLRKFIVRGGPARSFSTPGLLSALSDRAIIAADVRDKKLLELVTFSFATITPSVGLLLQAVQDIAQFPPSKLRTVFRVLTAPPTNLAEAGQILARVGKRLFTAPVQVRQLSDVMAVGLEAMAEGWPRTACAAALIQGARTEFSLLPVVVREIEQQAKAFATAGLFLN